MPGKVFWGISIASGFLIITAVILVVLLVVQPAGATITLSPDTPKKTTLFFFPQPNKFGDLSQYTNWKNFQGAPSFETYLDYIYPALNDTSSENVFQFDNEFASSFGANLKLSLFGAQNLNPFNNPNPPFLAWGCADLNGNGVGSQLTVLDNPQRLVFATVLVKNFSLDKIVTQNNFQIRDWTAPFETIYEIENGFVFQSLSGDFSDSPSQLVYKSTSAPTSTFVYFFLIGNRLATQSQWFQIQTLRITK